MKLLSATLLLATALPAFATDAVTTPITAPRPRPERESLIQQILRAEELRTQRPELQQDQARELQRTQEVRLGGSGIGGGSTFEGLILWCDQAATILHEARTEAREAWGLSGDAVEALSIYKSGLNAAQLRAPEHQTLGMVYTLRYARRGLVLTQILGVDDVLEGRTLAQKNTEGLVSFLDWYVGFTRDVGQDLDRHLYIPYITRRDCRDCRPVSSIELENRAVRVSLGVLRELDGRFVRMQRDGSNLYSTIAVPTYLKAQSYLLAQIAGDLKESIYAESFACQAGRMEQLSEQIQRYLSTRSGNGQDAIRLNRFSLSMRDIIQKLSDRNCF